MKMQNNHEKTVEETPEQNKSMPVCLRMVTGGPVCFKSSDKNATVKRIMTEVLFTVTVPVFLCVRPLISSTDIAGISQFYTVY